jgi:hypothetical protein
LRTLKHQIMKKVFTLLLLLAGVAATAQQFNNEWIKFSQTYYKFKIANQGIVRIPKATLDAAGVGGTQVQFLELWRNGEKVPFYPSVSSGVLPANGYIEFWGEPNDGKPDKALYRSPIYQHRDVYSLETDTAVYFLSVNTNQSGIRYTDVVNNTSGGGTPESWFMYTASNDIRYRQNQGFAVDLKEYLYSSSYDKGEYWSSGDIYPTIPFPAGFTNLSVYTGGPAASLRFGMSGNALNARTVKTTLNGTEVSNLVMDYFNDYIEPGVSIPNSLISSGTADIQFLNGSAIASDRMVVSFSELTYPRQFKFGNSTRFKFTLPAKPGGYFLQITEFNYGSTAPVLYDIAQGQRFTGDITTTPGSVLFALPGTTGPRNLVLVNVEAPNVTTVTQLRTKQFVDYTKTANQGDYLIITHPIFYNGTSGNPINDYKAYRASPAGGNYEVMVADIDELVDQFAYGIKKHPLSVRNFIRFARANFSKLPKNIFIIGRGMIYNEYWLHQSEEIIDRLNIVPTFGNPGSDNLLASADILSPVPATPIGRLSVVSPQEVSDYLQKLKQYENTQQNAPYTLAAREWMKNVIQVTGSSDAYLGTVLCNYMGVYKQIIEDTSYGAKVSTFCKNSTATNEELASSRIAHLLEEGASFLTYFGHSSATTLEFNLDNPQAYNNQGKYPVFFVNGCNAGNFFTYYPQRITANETLSEKFTLAKERGSIAFVASTHFGIVNYLNLFLTNLYDIISHVDYDKTLGETNQHAFQAMLNTTGVNDFYTRIHAEQITLHGDPALMLNATAKPDYVVEESSIKINPSFISVAEPNFEVKLRMVNLGRSISDSIVVLVTQKYPDQTSAVIYRQKIRAIRAVDSFTLQVPIVPNRDIGQHTITITLDEEAAVDEMTESNNIATKQFYVFQDEARPVYPYNYGITNGPVGKLYASTANPFSTPKNYVMEIDTTLAFNSPVKVSKKMNSAGGLLEFEPGLSYIDSTVYYWRTAPEVTGDAAFQWSNASFLYLANGSEGYSQAHYFQHLKSEFNHVTYNTNRTWSFNTSKHKIYVQNSVYPTGSGQQSAYFTLLDDVAVLGAGCEYNELIFSIVHPVTFKPVPNDFSGATGLYGSKKKASCMTGTRVNNYFFSTTTAADRKKAMDFMDAVPEGYYVVVRTNASPERPFTSDPANVFVDQWLADTTLYGSNNSIYHKLFYAGFFEVDSFYFPRGFSFVYKKGDVNSARYGLSKDANTHFTLSVDCFTPDTVGTVKSPKFGPAAEWKQVMWGGKSLETPSTDNPSVDIIGVDNNNLETVLYTIDRNTQTFDVSAVNPTQYPYMRLKMRNIDSVNLTPYQLKYWNISYKPVPEGVLAPNIFVVSKDTIEYGEPLKFSIAFKNVSRTAFDSMLVKATLLDKSNVNHIITLPKYKPIISGDTIRIEFELDSKLYTGNNTLYLNVNPDLVQPEEYSFNNFLFRNVYVKTDNVNPFLDVTFDGIHILNRDIVSAKPHIQIKLKDESKFMLLNDTALASVEVKYANGIVRTYHFDGDTLRFTPATTGTDNAALIDFTPAFTNQINPEGDDYEMTVKGSDRSGNKAGGSQYKVSFRVINKPMISNLLNYPNPFSTSTAFVFTLTGSEVPQNLKIQILTVTGKIVREITIDELGPLRIGRNITQYKWDGNDQYGQKLGNGVYLYRVVTSLNGKTLDKYKAKTDNTDQFFTNGYGKMYLMR